MKTLLRKTCSKLFELDLPSIGTQDALAILKIFEGYITGKRPCQRIFSDFLVFGKSQGGTELISTEEGSEILEALKENGTNVLSSKRGKNTVGIYLDARLSES